MVGVVPVRSHRYKLHIETFNKKWPKMYIICLIKCLNKQNVINYDGFELASQNTIFP